MKIIAIMSGLGDVYEVGQPSPHANDLVVEKITFNRPEKVYNGGFQTSRPGYTIFFVDSPIRRLIPELNVDEIVVDSTKNKEEQGVIPELPAGEEEEDG